MKLLFIILCAFLYTVTGNEEDFKKLDSIVEEQLCTSLGGFCTIAADCPKGHLAAKSGLCPKQQSQGVECCHGLSLKETRCERHGGMCISQSTFCNPQLIYPATDCTSDQKCCILV